MQELNKPINKALKPDVSRFLPLNLDALPTNIYVNYIDVLLLKYKNLVCNTTNISRLSEYFIEIDVANLTFKFSEHFKILLNNCKSTKKQIYIIPIHLRFPTTFETNGNPDFITQGHSNTVIIDNKYHTIEFFEPHGGVYKGGLPFDTEKIIKHVLSYIFPSRTERYVFENVYSRCPSLGVQKNDNMCLAWSLLFIELRLMNRKWLASDIIIDISDLSLDYLQRYLTYVMTQLNQTNIKNTFYSYPETKIFGLSLNDVIPTEILTIRIKNLLEQYDFLSQLLSLHLVEPLEFQNKRKIVFNELISYRNFDSFHDILINHFDKKCNYPTNLSTILF
jgi:hypothetical protein